MSTDWQYVREILEQICDLPPAEREAVLDARCHGDNELRSEVESVLSAMDETPGFMSEPVSLHRIARQNGSPVHSMMNMRVGSYSIKQFLSSGGMSDVYLADSESQNGDSQVAIKIICRPLFDDEVRRRFNIEREALAALEHPHIAKLIDAGVTDDGYPFLAIEYIDGQPIHKYCDAQRMTTDQRLALFREVCSAVSHAHQHLIVHRDLKPGNILVTQDGRPKLLDFGIAKLIDAAAGAGSSAFPMTATAHRVFTPEYASPEQIRGQLVSTSTDVYSLGIVLYELLTGRRPFQLGGRSRHEIERTVCESVPDKPSTVISGDAVTTSTEPRQDDTPTPQMLAQLRRDEPTNLKRRIEGDLDAIVMTAIRKEPERRYSSVQQLSTDIELHQKGLPITARPDTARYRMSKFVHRHRFAAVVSGLIVVAGILGLAGLAWHVHQVNQARILADTMAARKTIVSQFLQEMFESFDVMEGKPQDATVRELIDVAAKRIDSGELDDQPEVKATLLLTLGRAYAELGDLPEARKYLNESHHIRQAFHGDFHPEVAESLNALCMLAWQSGELVEAEETCRIVLSIRSELYESDNLETAESLNNLGVVLRRVRKLKEAEPVLRQALQIRQSLLGDDHLDVATTSVNLAVVLKHLGKLDEAETLYRSALAAFKEQAGPSHIRVAGCLNNLALLLRDKGELNEATSLLKESLKIRSDVFSGDHPSIATGHHNLGLIENDLGSPLLAKEHFIEALEMRRRLFGPDHPAIGNAAHNLASVLTHLGRLQDAEILAAEALRIRENRDQRTGSPTPRTAMTHILFADIAWQRNEYTETEKRATEGLEILQSLNMASSETARLGFALRGLSVAAMGNREDALADLNDAMDHLDDARRINERTTARICMLANVLDQTDVDSDICKNNGQ